MQITINNVTLADGSIQSPANFQVEEQRSIQRSDGLRSRFTRFFDRQNISHRITFEVPWLLESLADAEEFILTHSATVPNSGLLKYTTAGGKSFWMQATACETVGFRQTGQTIHVTYSLSGGEILTSAPIS